MMPIVDGKFESRISTYYRTPEEGIADIKKKVERSRKIRLSNLPAGLLDELKPLLVNKDLKVILPEGQKPDESLKALGAVASTKSRIYVDYMGVEANSGSVSFADRMFNIFWTDGKVLAVTSMDYPKCAHCMVDTFETGWRYSQKW